VHNFSLKKLLHGTAFLAFIACFLWSTAFAAVKIGLNFMSPLQFAGIRFFISGLLILPLCGNLRSYFFYIKNNIKHVLWVAFLQTFLMYSLFYTGMNMVPASLGAMVIGTGPLFAALVAHFTLQNDKINRRTFISFIIGIIGIAIIHLGRQSKGIVGAMEVWGMFILVLNNIVGGLYNVVVMKSKSNIPPTVLSSASLWIGGLSLFCISIPLEGIQIQSYPVEFYLSLSWLAFLSAASFSIWFGLLRRPGIKISYLNSWKFIIPVLGATLSWILIKDETPDGYTFIGMLVVGLSLLVMNHELLRDLFGKK
jgi:drug/metabolite transporter (DMT)-like permease